MKNLRLISFLTFLMTILSFHGFAQTESVMIVAKNEYRYFSISVLNNENVSTFNRYRKKEHSITLNLKKELDKWFKQGYRIEDSSTVYWDNENGKHHVVTYIMTKEIEVEAEKVAD